MQGFQFVASVLHTSYLNLNLLQGSVASGDDRFSHPYAFPPPNMLSNLPVYTLIPTLIQSALQTILASNRKVIFFLIYTNHSSLSAKLIVNAL